ncbi:MAG: hypothetical protein IH945_04745 [Armatimonadetes bacterium]|nr:hypothetical protein [Armatimonadota bacterium]
MARPDPSLSQESSDALMGFIDAVARFVMYVGLGALLVSVTLLIHTATSGSGSSEQVLQQAQSNVALFGKLALIGGLAGAAGLTWLLWGEETLGVLQIIVGAALYFSPSYLPGMFNMMANPTVESALQAIATAGAPIAVIGVLVILIDLTIRMKTRVREGARADQMKFGKGMREERDIRNVFLGKCWQLPYCRKFVRERCPIYHSRRTCWKEQVGCMCEESVIRNAMEGKVIPSDIVAAAKFIPRNARLTPGQKFERCKQCVIYNEHQKHKYQLALPISALLLVGVYMALRIPIRNQMNVFLEKIDGVMGKATFNATGGGPETELASLTGGIIPYAEIIMVSCSLIIFAYMVRLIEYVFFKLKI